MAHEEPRYFILPASLGFISSGCEKYLTIHKSLNLTVELYVIIKNLRFQRRVFLPHTLLDFDNKLANLEMSFKRLGMTDIQQKYLAGGLINATRLILKMDGITENDRLIIESGEKNGFYMVAVAEPKIHYSDKKGLYVKIKHPSPVGTYHDLLSRENMTLLSYLEALKIMQVDKERLTDPFKAYFALDREWKAVIQDAEDGV